MKFLIGDKVRCIRASRHQYIKKNSIYTIKNIIRDEYLQFHEIHQDHTYNPSAFEKFVENYFEEDLFTI